MLQEALAPLLAALDTAKAPPAQRRRRATPAAAPSRPPAKKAAAAPRGRTPART